MTTIQNKVSAQETFDLLRNSQTEGRLSIMIFLAIWVSAYSNDHYPTELPIGCPEVIKNSNAVMVGRTRDYVYGYGDALIKIKDDCIVFERWSRGSLGSQKELLFRIVLKPKDDEWEVSLSEGSELQRLRTEPKRKFGELGKDWARVTFAANITQAHS